MKTFFYFKKKTLLCIKTINKCICGLRLFVHLINTVEGTVGEIKGVKLIIL